MFLSPSGDSGEQPGLTRKLGFQNSQEDKGELWEGIPKSTGQLVKEVDMLGLSRSVPGSPQHQAPNSVHTAANRWLKADGGGNGVRAEPHNGSESEGGEKGELTLSVPEPEREGPGASTDVSCGWTGPPVVLLESTTSAALLWTGHLLPIF